MKGVITGISTDVSVESIKRNLSGAVVVDVKRLKYVKNEQKVDSLSVMIHFDAEKFPEKVYLGYLSYVVRPYIPPPIRCFKCQKFGHVAAVCNGKQRCARCGGEHEYRKCGHAVDPKCCNCGENHSAGYGGCKVRKDAVKAQNISVSEGVSYVEALKRVQKNQKTSAGNAELVEKSSTVDEQVNSRRVKDNTMLIDKMSFIAFMAEVVNCSAQTESRTERIRIILRAAGKYLDVEGVTVEQVNEKLKVQISNTQTACGGS